MRNLIFDLLLGRAFDNPFPGKKKTDTEQTPKPVEEKLHRTPTKGVPVREVDEFEWEIAKGRNPVVTDADKKLVLESRTGKPADRLKLDKYIELKPLWADGQSSLEVSRLPQYKGQHGYGHRTLEKYWAAMYKAHIEGGKAKITESNRK